MRVPLLLAAWLCSGCFVVDELDAGMEILEAHTPKEKAAPEEPAAPAAPARKADSGPGMLEELQSWASKKLEKPPPPPDPDDAIVRCIVRGSVQFTRKYECAMKGGRAIALDPEPSTK